MNDGFSGDASQGMGETTNSSEGQVVQEPSQEIQSVDPAVGGASEGQQVDNSSDGLMSTIQSQREELERIREHNEFLQSVLDGSGVSLGQQQQPQQPGNQEGYLDDSDVPLFGDVKKVVADEIRQSMEQQRQQYVLNEIAGIAEQKSQSDPDFQNKMQLAEMVVRGNPAYMQKLNSLQTGRDKVAFMEMAAKQHPLYSRLQQVVSPEATATMEKIKQNSQIPTSLASAAGGVTQTPVSQMSDEQYLKYLDDVKKGKV